MTYIYVFSSYCSVILISRMKIDSSNVKKFNNSVVRYVDMHQLYKTGIKETFDTFW